MAFRKTGSVTGEVTEVEQVPESLSKEASRKPGEPWSGQDEQALAGENSGADGGTYSNPTPEGFHLADGSRTVTLD